MQGDYELKNQIDSSHKFLYGHRYWPQVKKAVETFADTFNAQVGGTLADQILQVANQAARAARVDAGLTTGITAVAFMTLQQVGSDAFKSAKGEMLLDKKLAKRSAEQVLRDRAVDDSQGFLGFLKTIDKKWTVTYDETDAGAKYKLNHVQDLAWGAAEDRTRNWREVDPRRVEGPIPVECRSASCGTCWVGVPGRRGKTFGRGRARRKEDQGVWLHRHHGTKTTDSFGLSGAGPGSSFHCYPTVERCVWQAC